MLREASEGFNAVIGGRHLHTIKCFGSLASVLTELGATHRARHAVVFCCEHRVSAAPAVEYIMARNYPVIGYRRACVLLPPQVAHLPPPRAGRYADAEAIFLKMLSASRETNGVTHAITLSLAINYVILLKEIGGEQPHAAARCLLGGSAARQRRRASAGAAAGDCLLWRPSRVIMPHVVPGLIVSLLSRTQTVIYAGHRRSGGSSGRRDRTMSQPDENIPIAWLIISPTLLRRPSTHRLRPVGSSRGALQRGPCGAARDFRRPRVHVQHARRASSSSQRGRCGPLARVLSC